MAQEKKTFLGDIPVRIILILIIILFLALPQSLLIFLIPMIGLPMMFTLMLTVFLCAILFFIQFPLLFSFSQLFLQILPSRLIITPGSIISIYGMNKFLLQWNEVEEFFYQYAVIRIPFMGDNYIKVYELKSGNHWVRFTRMSTVPPVEDQHWLKVFPFFDKKTWDIKQFGVPVDRNVCSTLVEEIESRLGKPVESKKFLRQ
jgi:hypothetical protein